MEALEKQLGEHCPVDCVLTLTYPNFHERVPQRAEVELFHRDSRAPLRSRRLADRLVGGRQAAVTMPVTPLKLVWYAPFGSESTLCQRGDGFANGQLFLNAARVKRVGVDAITSRHGSTSALYSRSRILGSSKRRDRGHRLGLV